ncbi:hypothetical protein LSH36_903g00013 [Paralvinella palmiformis]|uniref:ABC transporter domain-containing protein n=1 Tax=Paralvinella palmiformis TaxID=53620 RepID=A0AAD9MTX2_9ANNE|nr:hypothetical protein LSH36_903g00013 [Paralvinella palmiformis]
MMEVIFKDVDVAIDDTLILHHISGMVKPGEMLAVMGPSGAGKSTLLNAISSRTPILSGCIRLNGAPVNHKLRRKICYVLQEDAFFSNLTLKQTLTRVNDIIDQLDLRDCANTAMGGMFMSGLSGGERKRASIASELVTNPMLLMLDVAYFGKSSQILEFFSSLSLHCTPNWNPADFIFTERLSVIPFPTCQFVPQMTCMENSTSWTSVHRILISKADLRQSLGYDQRNILDIHTPSVFDFNPKTQRYQLDWPPELRSGDVSVSTDLSEVKFQPSADQLPPNDVHQQNSNIPDKDEELATTQLIVKPSPSNTNDKMNDVIVVCSSSLSRKEAVDEEYSMDNSYYDETAKWQSGFITQYVTLTQRNFFQAKSRILSKLNFIQTVVLSVVSGLLWFQTPRTEESLKDRNGMMFFVISYFGFFTMFDIITSFPDERTVITKERAAGTYRLSAYYLSKMTSEAPLMFLLPIIMTTISYWMTGLMPTAGNFVAFLMLVLLHSSVAQSFGIVVGVSCIDLRTSITTGATIMLATLLAGGFYITHYPVWMEWAKYLSFLQYSYHAAMKIEYLHGSDILCNPPGESVFDLCNQNETSFITGEYYLACSGVTHPIFLDVLVLVTLGFAFRLLGYVILRYIRRPGGCRCK